MNVTLRKPTEDQLKLQDELVKKTFKVIYGEVVSPIMHYEELPLFMRYSSLAMIFENCIAATLLTANLSNNFDIPAEDFMDDMKRGVLESYRDLADKLPFGERQ